MREFHIEDEFYEDHIVDEKEFRQTLNELKEIWEGDYDMKIDPQEQRMDCSVMQEWTFPNVSMWVIAEDYEELKELNL